MKTKTLFAAAAFACAMLSTGCTTTAGHTVDQAHLSAIVVGRTTEAQLVGLFGPPSGVGLDERGRRMLIWEYLQARSNAKAFVPVAGMFLNSTDVTEPTLKVSLDKSGVVADTHLEEENRQASIFKANK